MSAACTSRSARCWPRPSSDVGARSTTTRRPTATARCRSGSTCTSGRASRVRAAAARSSGSSWAPDRRICAPGASACPPAIVGARGSILRTMTGGDVRRGRRWTELPGQDDLGPTAAEAARTAATERTERTKRAAATRRRHRPGGRGRGLMSILRLSGVTREVGTFTILDSIDAAVALGDRIGLVGPNGAGKTTLLRLAAGLDEPDRGSVQPQAWPVARAARPGVALRRGIHGGARPAHRRPGRRRPPRDDGRRARGVRTRRTRHRARVRRSPAPVRGAGRIHARPARGCRLSGLGFARDEWAKPPSAMSGGEQTRAALARLVIARSGPAAARRADEPPRPRCPRMAGGAPAPAGRRAVVASHDRAFLDATVTRIWELRDRRVTAFRGDYRAYHRQREERDARARKEAGTQADSIAREQRARPALSEPAQVQQDARARGAARAAPGGAREAPRASRTTDAPAAALAGAGPARSGEIVVRVEDLVVGYLPGRGASPRTGSRRSSRVPWRRVPFLAAQRGERVGIVGPNGAGKTTLLRTVAGDLPPLDGTLTFGHAVQLGYLAQMRDAAIPGATVIDAMLEVDPGHARRGARLPGALPVPRRGRVQGGPCAVGRRAVAPGARARWASCRRICCCSTSRPTTSTSRPARRSRRSCATPRHAHGRVPRPAPARGRVRPTVGCRRRGRRWRSTAATARGEPPWPMAGPWRRPSAHRANVFGRRGRGRAPSRPTVLAGAGAPPRPTTAVGWRRPRARATRPRRLGEAVQGRLPAAEGQPRGELTASACARASSSSRWAIRRSRRTSSRCAA